MGDEKNLGMSQKTLSPSRSTSSCSSKQGGRQDSWEVVEGLRGSMNYTQEMQRQEGYLLKRRKWPLKGWHKRYFFLDKGILKYAKTQADIEKGKLHGCIDVGLSVMSVKKSTKCIDLDTEEHIYHLKVKSQELFEEWVSKLRDHRLYRQNEISMFPQNNIFFPLATVTDSPSPCDPSSVRRASGVMRLNPVQAGSGLPFHCAGSESRVPQWLQSSEDMDKCSEDLTRCRSYLADMNQLLQNMEVLHRTYSAPAINAFQVSSFESPKKEKVSRRKGWRTKGMGKDAKGTLQVPSDFIGPMRLHASNPNLSTMDYADEKNYSDSSESSAEFSKMQEDLCNIAHKVYFVLKSAFNTVCAEREKVKQILEHDTCSSPSVQVVGLKNALSSENLNEEHRPLVSQLSSDRRMSLADSITEFFDAQEVLLSASSSENELSEDDSYVSDISDNISEDYLSNGNENERQTIDCMAGINAPCHSERRSRLPAPSPNTSNISVWNILRNNIGKDLSKVCMPVQLNEPLNTLQRLCEELEYSELLDQAAETSDPFERMVYVAAFAVSAYASSFYRAGSKPFNPVLGETYEYVKEDKGFRFIAEQKAAHALGSRQVELRVEHHKTVPGTRHVKLESMNRIQP